MKCKVCNEDFTVTPLIKVLGKICSSNCYNILNHKKGNIIEITGDINATRN